MYTHSMARTNVTTFRASDELLARLDAHALSMSRLAGVRVTRAAVIPKLLGEALDRTEGKKPKKK